MKILIYVLALTILSFQSCNKKNQDHLVKMDKAYFEITHRCIVSRPWEHIGGVIDLTKKLYSIDDELSERGNPCDKPKNSSTPIEKEINTFFQNTTLNQKDFIWDVVFASNSTKHKTKIFLFPETHFRGHRTPKLKNRYIDLGINAATNAFKIIQSGKTLLVSSEIKSYSTIFYELYSQEDFFKELEKASSLLGVFAPSLMQSQMIYQRELEPVENPENRTNIIFLTTYAKALYLYKKKDKILQYILDDWKSFGINYLPNISQDELKTLFEKQYSKNQDLDQTFEELQNETEQRGIEMSSKLLDQLKISDTDYAYVSFGSSHIGTIASVLRKQGYSYVILSPSY